MLRALKSKMIIALICLATFLFVSNICFAENKIGYVDVNEVFNSYKKTQQADKQLEDKQEKKQKQREKLVSEIRKLKNKLELLSDEAKKKKQEQINEKIKKLQEFDRETRNELLKERDDAAKEIIEELDEVIKKIGKQGNYTFIFNERSILYGSKQHDLTDKVLESLNKR